MVIKIQRGAASCRTPVGYNERKVASGEAQVVGVSGMNGDSIATVIRTFDTYENNPAISARTRSLSFHMTINPGPGERLSDESLMALTRDLMGGLGYSGQPYIVYRHQDTGREHFHVVSVRVDKDGKVISNSNERRILQRLMKELGPRYGFVTGKEQASVSKEVSPESRIMRFDPEKGSHLEQIKNILEGCLGYCFTSERQLDTLLEHFGVRLVRCNHPEGMRIMAQGLDHVGIPSGRPICGNDLGMDLPVTIAERLDDGTREMRMKRQERNRVRGNALSYLGYSTSALHFERMMEKKGITPVFSRTGEGGIFGVTFLDHQGKCIFKCSDLGDGINASLFKEAEESGRWKRAELGSEHVPVSVEDEKPSEDIVDKVLQSLDSTDKSRERDLPLKRKRRKGMKL